MSAISEMYQEMKADQIKDKPRTIRGVHDDPEAQLRQMRSANCHLDITQVGEWHWRIAVTAGSLMGYASVNYDLTYTVEADTMNNATRKAYDVFCALMRVRDGKGFPTYKRGF